MIFALAPQRFASPPAPVGTGPIAGMFEIIANAAPYLVVIGLLAGFTYQAMRRMRRRDPSRIALDRLCILVVLLAGMLLTGTAIYRGYRGPTWSNRALIMGVTFIVTVGLCFIPRVRDWIRGPIGRLNRMSDRQQFWTAISLVLLCAVYFPVVGLLQGRGFNPTIQDELSYAVMARIFSSGHLWMPAHPLPEAFESFYIFSSPVYGSMYFPGAGFLFALPLLLGLPLWTASVAAMSVFTAMVFRLIARLFSPAMGLASVCGLLGVTHFRWFSTHTLSHVPLSAAVALAYWSHVRWNENGARRWLAAFALFGAFAAITRPYDAILLLLPSTVSIALALINRGARRAVGSAALVVACAVPFFSLQLVYDHAFTGHALKTPFAEYFDQDMPNAGFGFYPFDRNVRPLSRLRQKIDFYDLFISVTMDYHSVDAAKTGTFWLTRATLFLSSLYGQQFMLTVIPIGLIAALRRKRWPIALGLPALFVGYIPYPHFLPWYGISTSASLFVCYWSSIRPIALATGLRRAVLERGVIVATIAVGIVGQPFWWPGKIDSKLFESAELNEIDSKLAEHVQRPALVFFLYTSKRDTRSQSEPVYNWETAWPDDAGIIRVHSRGFEQDVRVIKYYQQQNGSRRLYVYDRERRTLIDEGTIDKFLKNLTDAATTRAARATK